MSEKIKAITFDLDDTFWDVKPVLINAEMKTRKFIEDKIGKLEWGSWEEFKLIREKLIIEDASYEFDVGKLRKKLLLMKIQERVSDEETANELSESAFQLFFQERNKVEFFKFNISSKDVSANKPSENHFHKAIELLGVSKEELLHIGDHKINDMHGAISYGVQALWFNPNKEIWDLEGVEKPPEFSIWQGLTEKIDSLYS
jgi:putative hydrolase of the HAD superfamily